MTENKKKTTKKDTKVDKKKLKREYPFLNFVANNPHPNQLKRFLCLDLIPEQYTVLKEIAVNELANNLPTYSGKKRKDHLKTVHIQRLRKLARGALKRTNLKGIIELVQILCRDVIAHHDLKGEKTRYSTRGSVEKGDKE